MSKKLKKWFIAAASLAVIGVIMFAVVMASHRFNFSDLNTNKLETNTYEINEEFNGIKINTETADIIFVTSSDSKSKVICYEEENFKHSTSVEDGTLIISASDTRNWIDHIGFNLESPKVTLYLPKLEYDSLIINESTGDITLPKDFIFNSIDLNLSTSDVDCSSSAKDISVEASTSNVNLHNLEAENIDVAVSTGQVDVQSLSCDSIIVKVTTGETKLKDVSCNNIKSTGSTGDISLKNVVAKEKAYIERSTGDVRLEGSDAGEFEITTETGQITGSILSAKVFIAHSDTGSVSVPETITGGKCKITTDTGNIKITIK